MINRGSITADGGAVALLGGQVSNHGIIQANQSSVALAAGDKITLDFAGDGLLNVTVDEGTIDALVENHQLVRANGGQVVMTANATNALLQTVVNNTGIIEAQTLDNQSGTIVLKGGFNGGTVNVAGTLDASAPDSGDGGFIDTSGAHVKIAGGTRVTTKANHGTTGEWLIDPTDFYITDSNDPQTDSGIGADTLSANLANNSITLQTVASGSEAGDINVQAAVTWNADTTLTLNAHNDININAAITAQGANGKVALQYGQATPDGGAADYHIPALLFFTCPLASFSNLASQPVQQGTDRAFALARKHNVKVAFGTDMLGTGNLGESQNALLVSMQRWYSPGEVLQIATGNNGALLSLAGPRYPLPAEVGVIRAGAVADLLLVDGDPTADLSLIADPENYFLLIIKQGKIYKNIL